MKDSSITVTDQFCGAGGSSSGARKALEKGGGKVAVAMNHWKLAIETHNTNFPDTIHDCTDVSACDPRRYPSTDILITSPECTNHSLAKGQKQVKAQLDLFNSFKLDPAAERSRATMWDVPRFAEYHRYNIIIVENVVDARKWVQFPAWLQAMDLLGYNHKCCYFNSMHFHPTPQSRDRMYVVFWRKGNKAPDLEFTPKAHCPECGHDIEAMQGWKKQQNGKYKTQYKYYCKAHMREVTPYYYAAFNAIDWSDIGSRIGDRKKPLSVNTVKRIQYGLDKYGKDPFQVVNYSPGTSKSIVDPVSTITTKDHNSLCIPFVVNDQHSTGIGTRVRGASEPLSTMAGTHHMKLITPFIIKGEHTMQQGYVRSVNEEMQTQTVRQSMALISPQVIEMTRTGKARDVDQPLSTVLANGNHRGLMLPFVPISRGQSKSKSVTDPLTTQSSKVNSGMVTTEAWNTFIGYYYGKSMTSPITEPLGTCTTKERHFVVNTQAPKIEDCFFRMLKPHEIKKSMAFDDDYIILGSGKDQVKQCGNAVTPPVMEWLVGRCVESLTA